MLLPPVIKITRDDKKNIESVYRIRNGIALTLPINNSNHPGGGNNNLADEDDDDDFVDVEFTRLGYITFSDNTATGYKARELKSVHIDAEGDFFKLVIHQNYINPLNLYNQVGIVAINLLGDIKDPKFFAKAITDQEKIALGVDPLSLDQLSISGLSRADPNDLAKLTTTVQALPTVVPSPKKVHPANASNDLAFDINHDDELTKVMSAISTAKIEAVQEEDFARAKRLKLLYQQAKTASEEVAKFKVAKARAVEREDYELAEDIKLDIEDCKSTLFSKLTELGFKYSPATGLLERIPESTSSKQPTTPAITKFVNNDEEPVAAAKVVKQELGAEDFPVQTSTVAAGAKSPNRQTAKPDDLPIPREPPKSPPLPALMNRNKTSAPFELDEQPSNSGGSVSADGLAEPEKLSAKDQDVFADCILVHGEFLVRCLLSRVFKLREWALEEVSKRLQVWGSQLESRSSKALSKGKKRKGGKETPHDKDKEESSGETSHPGPPPVMMIQVSWKQEVEANDVGPEMFVSGTVQVVKKGLEDSREKVALQSLSVCVLLTELCVKYHVSTGGVFKYYEGLLPALVVKAADLNARVKKGCFDAVSTLADAYHVLPYSFPKLLVKPVPAKPAQPWRVTKARLEALLQVLKSYGVDDLAGGHGKESKEKADVGKRRHAHETGMTVESVMAAAKPHMQHKNVEVRDTAIQIVVELIALAGEDAIAKYLSDVPEQQMAVVRERIEESKGVVAASKLLRSKSALSMTGSVSGGLASGRKTPWKSQTALAAEANEEVVKRLQEEVDALKGMVDGAPAPPGLGKVKRDSGNVDVAFETMGKPDSSQSAFADIAAAFDKTCIFCEESNPDFNEETLDVHYWRECCMLCACPLCTQIVEVPVLTTHMVSECDNRAMVKLCPRCQEAILATEYIPHMSRQSCIPASVIPGVSRCPLCHLDIPNGETGWKRHLLKGEGCPENQRKPPKHVIPRQPPPPGSGYPPITNSRGTPQYHTISQPQDRLEPGKLPSVVPMGIGTPPRTTGGAGRSGGGGGVAGHGKTRKSGVVSNERNRR